MNPLWFVRLAKWGRHPPSLFMVKLVFAIVALCALLFGVEYFVGWPDFLSLERPSRPRFTSP